MFNKCLEFVLKWEGWKSDNAHDPGGRTVWGITARDYPTEVEAMWGMSQEDSKKVAESIYRAKYWEPAGCDAYDFPWNLIIFDAAVNCGVHNAIKWIDEVDTWQGYLFRRIEYYAKLNIFREFGKGWINRVIDLYKT